MNEKPNYYAIIPGNVRYDPELKDKAKLLYGEITALSNKEGYCYASNNYFAELYGVTTQTIINMINNLIKKGYLERTIIYKEGTKEVEKRYLKIIEGGTKNIFTRGTQKIFIDNNTSINNTSINKKEIYKERFKKPSLEDIKEYCLQRNNNVNAQKFFDYYEANNWTDSKGNKVKSWKQKVITWETHQPKQQIKEDIIPEWFNKDFSNQKLMTDKDYKNEMEQLINEMSDSE